MAKSETPTPVTVPSTPTPTPQVLVYTVARSILMILGAVGIGVGANINDGALMIAAGALVDVGAAGWAVWEKFQAARREHQAAVISARAGKALKPKK